MSVENKDSEDASIAEALSKVSKDLVEYLKANKQAADGPKKPRLVNPYDLDRFDNDDDVFSHKKWESPSFEEDNEYPEEDAEDGDPYTEHNASSKEDLIYVTAKTDADFEDEEYEDEIRKASVGKTALNMMEIRHVLEDFITPNRQGVEFENLAADVAGELQAGDLKYKDAIQELYKFIWLKTEGGGAIESLHTTQLGFISTAARNMAEWYLKDALEHLQDHQDEGDEQEHMASANQEDLVYVRAYTASEKKAMRKQANCGGTCSCGESESPAVDEVGNLGEWEEDDQSIYNPEVGPAQKEYRPAPARVRQAPPPMEDYDEYADTDPEPVGSDANALPETLDFEEEDDMSYRKPQASRRGRLKAAIVDWPIPDGTPPSKPTRISTLSAFKAAYPDYYQDYAMSPQELESAADDYLSGITDAEDTQETLEYDLNFAINKHYREPAVKDYKRSLLEMLQLADYLSRSHSAGSRKQSNLFDPGPKASEVISEIKDVLGYVTRKMPELQDAADTPYTEYWEANMDNIMRYLKEALKASFKHPDGQELVDETYGWLNEAKIVSDGLLDASAGDPISRKHRSTLRDLFAKLSIVVTGMQHEFHFS